MKTSHVTAQGISRSFNSLLVVGLQPTFQQSRSTDAKVSHRVRVSSDQYSSEMDASKTRQDMIPTLNHNPGRARANGFAISTPRSIRAQRVSSDCPKLIQYLMARL
nr:hypothetical protein CFP56_63989 [Quercus suber]